MDRERLNALGETFRTNLTNYINHWIEQIMQERPSDAEYSGLMLHALNALDDFQAYLVGELESSKVS